MAEILTEKKQISNCFFQGKKILIIADSHFSEMVEILVSSDIDAIRKSEILYCSKNIFLGESISIKISFFKTLFPGKVWSDLGYSADEFDVLFYIGNQKSILKIIEKWCKNRALIYVGNRPTRRAMLQFVPDFNSNFSAQALCNLLNKLNV